MVLGTLKMMPWARPLVNRVSTAGGLRFMIQFPLSLARTTVAKAIERKNQRNGSSRSGRESVEQRDEQSPGS